MCELLSDLIKHIYKGFSLGVYMSLCSLKTVLTALKTVIKVAAEGDAA